jgi:ribonuclease P protein component
VKGQFSFTKKERLNNPGDFRSVMRLGRRGHSKSFIFFIQENKVGFHRLGTVVKKEIGPAAYRNRVKRYFREFFRLNKHRMKGSFDIIILAKKGYVLKQYIEAEKELKGAFPI